MTAHRSELDIIVVGGGIAGLWLLNRLCGQGYNAILLEQQALGSGQSVASQGMIHGGIKYALGGALTGASEAIGSMPGVWRDCIDGNGPVDLQGTHVLADHFFLWSDASLTSRLGSFFASKLLRGRVDEVADGERPVVFADPAFRGQLYKLSDLVLDIPSVLHKLARNVEGRVFPVDWRRSQITRDAQGLTGIDYGNGLILSARDYVFTAGIGNGALLEQLNISKPAMQLRPLQQVLVSHDYPQPLYAHCMGGNPSPRLTVSSHRRQDGRWTWYLGGDLATTGIGMESDALIQLARSELNALFPWIDFGRCEWQTLAVDRAEPKQRGLLKPDNAFAERATGCRNVLVGWPTKLTLAPDMADRVLAQLEPPGPPSALPTALSTLPPPAVADTPWDLLP